MSDGLLEYALTLDAGGFDKSMEHAIGKLHNFGHEAQQSGTHIGSLLGPLAKVAAAVGSLAVAAIGFEKFKEGVEHAFEMGHALEHVAEVTDETVSHIAVFQQALKDTGGSADQAESLLFRFEKGLSGVNEEGQSTDAVFKAMGLNMESLRAKMPLEALEEFRKSFAQFGTQDQNKILTEAFGKQGKDLKPFLGKDNAMAKASITVGSQAGILEANAATFSRVAALLNSAGMKMQGFYVGVAEKLAGPLLKTLESFNKLDFAPLGEQFGTIIRTWQDSISIAFKGMGTDYQSLQAKAKGFLADVQDASDRIKGVVMIVRGAFEQGSGLKIIGESIELGILTGINALTTGIIWVGDYLSGALPVLFNSLVDILTSGRIKLFFTSIFHGIGELLEASLDKVLAKFADMTGFSFDRDKYLSAAKGAESRASTYFATAGAAMHPDAKQAQQMLDGITATTKKVNAAGLENANGYQAQTGGTPEERAASEKWFAEQRAKKDKGETYDERLKPKNKSLFDTTDLKKQLLADMAEASKPGTKYLLGQLHSNYSNPPAPKEDPKGTQTLNLTADKDKKIEEKRREWELENVVLSARGMHQKREVELAEHALKLSKLKLQLMDDMKLSEQDATAAAEKRLALEDRIAHKPLHTLNLAASVAKHLSEFSQDAKDNAADHGRLLISQADKLALAAAEHHDLLKPLNTDSFINPARAAAALARSQPHGAEASRVARAREEKQDSDRKSTDSLYRAVKSIEEKFAALASA